VNSDFERFADTFADTLRTFADIAFFAGSATLPVASFAGTAYFADTPNFADTRNFAELDFADSNLAGSFADLAPSPSFSGSVLSHKDAINAASAKLCSDTQRRCPMRALLRWI